MMKRLAVLLPQFSFLCFFLFFTLVPAARAELTHIVKRGESLSSIAQKYQVSISEIKEANNLEDTRLQIGQSLTIPKPDPATSQNPSSRKGILENRAQEQEIPDTYVVKNGDTLGRIAKRYHLSVKDLQELNELKGTKLKAGQVLQLKREEEILEDPGMETWEGSSESPLASNDGSAIPISQGADGIEERDLNPLVTVAESFMGVKYRRGGTNVKTGLDCSAYVQKVFRMVGVDLPRTAREQFAVGLEVARDALRLGDLVFFKPSKGRRPAHVGIYLGNDQFIHTSLSKRRVRVDSLNTRYFLARFIGGRRIEEGKKQPVMERPPIDSAKVLAFHFEPVGYPPASSDSP